VILLFPVDVAAHRVSFWSIPLAWLVESIAALVRYGRLSSFHTYLSRTAAVAMGLFGAVLFTHGFEPLLLRLAAACVLVATCEEFVLLYLLPVWTPDVGGIVRVLSNAGGDQE
jgi:CDP-diacylglycerol--glycerol-3-phosphate 3-phosphatidyltransferase